MPTDITPPIAPDATLRTAVRPRKPLWHHLYFWVLLGIAAGIVIGLAAPQVGAQMKWLADLFIKLVKVVIAPTIFATVAVGIAGLGNLAKAGGLALKTVVYFNVTTVFALGIGLVVVNLLGPGRNLGLDIETFDASAAQGTLASAGAAAGDGITGFLLHLVPSSFFAAFVEGQLIQVLVMAILVACAITMLGERGKPAVAALDTIAQVMFGVIKIVMWFAPLGAMGGMAFTIGEYGGAILGSLGYFMLSFWLTCLLFLLLVLGPICWWSGFSVFKYIRMIRDELLIVLGTSSSETVLPRMLAKLEAAGVPKSVVGLTIPTGYSFNLDGTAIYMAMGAIFIAQAFGIEVPIGTQIALLVFMLISSNGAAGVSGAGLVTLAASLAAFESVIPLAGIALIVGIDRFMSEGRALTNLTGNGIGTLVIARWTGQLDRERLATVLDNPQLVDPDRVLAEQAARDAGPSVETAPARPA
ncbi:cation:dicarboxylase symporter family transporter [Luteimonas sp. S4-F44]|uniref:cation:dicarboxylate symporter family transporter n=1 Tax=Luteimonas sp. S4-F44 TaxID=2925842 RepID=UPI001F53AFBC|nr:cation:dicarboxylase symporter family transporter [Luteimonas sp. S4-F44]UNK43534.1 cation:dicarboxylase symporter family transporter [Luteimonas sp. S4-F44]